MNRFKLCILFCLAFAMYPAAAHAQKACTQMGCTNGLQLSVNPDYDWKNGIYVFEFYLDGKNVKCTGALPLKECDKGPSLSCNKEGVMITESGCALPASAQGFGDIQINSEPKRVLIRVTRNGKPVVTRTIVPKYQTLAPNGPGCGPVCTSARHDLFHAQ